MFQLELKNDATNREHTTATASVIYCEKIDCTDLYGKRAMHAQRDRPTTAHATPNQMLQGLYMTAFFWTARART